ncbi:hypothetical protein GW7_04726 [Heterocephalus glaber]|uniref:Uncharacterized protein n=1 Tax=Heterocephalus glaber TaxID=10181 RepID=G5BV90_HETGA|nr:hypothetical protein GW7_04726 [Heterocephalus glaber]
MVPYHIPNKNDLKKGVRLQLFVTQMGVSDGGLGEYSSSLNGCHGNLEPGL